MKVANRYKWLLPPIFFIGFAALFHFWSSNIVDLDSFYYIRQSWLLRTNGLFDVTFPWAQFSVIKLFSASLWYGFAFLLVPFTLIGNLFIGIKIAGVIFTAAALFSFYWVMNRHQFRWPFLWPLLLFFSVPNVLAQFLMVRPQIVSLALVPILFSLLIMGSWPGIAFASFGIAWAHLNFAWLPALIFAVVATAQFFTYGRSRWKELVYKGGAILGGLLLGWALRPNPFGALRLFYVQVIQQVFQKQGGLPLLFGKENLPLKFTALFQNFSPFLILLGGAIFIFWFQMWKHKPVSQDQKIVLWSSAALAIIFFIFTMLVARRAYNFWAEFGIIFVAAVFSYCISSNSSHKPIAQSSATMLAIIFVFMIFYSGSKGVAAIGKDGYKPTELQEAALWLRDNSQSGEIVFNLHWPDFSALFFWNQKNYYISGLDPIFQYEYSPSLYWKFHYLATDVVTKKTCGAIACTRDMLEDTYGVLKKDFQAKYVLLTKMENPAVRQFLEGDSHFEKKFETNFEAIYLIK